jgi:hypothetical protein
MTILQDRAINKLALERRDRHSALEHSVALVDRVCQLAGDQEFIESLQITSDRDSLRVIIGRNDTPALFDWLLDSFSYQGISDQVAYGYMERHGRLTWPEINRSLEQRPTCPKLTGHWRFESCRYDKGKQTCSEPTHFPACPLPKRNLRNGRLNQTAYSFFLFVRDVCGGDLVRWIDDRLTPIQLHGLSGVSEAQDALLAPLRNVYGVADKILMMSLSSVLISAPKTKSHWFEAGVGMIAVDTLVHAFMQRTGILHRFAADHPYGTGCYQPGGCADIIREIAARIDARKFNPGFPVRFPRFVQHAVWRYCAQRGLDICNGNRIDDEKRCQNRHCDIRYLCDRKRIKRQ